MLCKTFVVVVVVAIASIILYVNLANRNEILEWSFGLNDRIVKWSNSFRNNFNFQLCFQNHTSDEKIFIKKRRKTIKLAISVFFDNGQMSVNLWYFADHTFFSLFDWTPWLLKWAEMKSVEIALPFQSEIFKKFKTTFSLKNGNRRPTTR